jgi:hypothetical protein
MTGGRCMMGCGRSFIGQRGRRVGLTPLFEVIGIGLVGWAGPTFYCVGEVQRGMTNQSGIARCYLQAGQEIPILVGRKIYPIGGSSSEHKRILEEKYPMLENHFSPFYHFA